MLTYFDLDLTLGVPWWICLNSFPKPRQRESSLVWIIFNLGEAITSGIGIPTVYLGLPSWTLVSYHLSSPEGVATLQSFGYRTSKNFGWKVKLYLPLGNSQLPPGISNKLLEYVILLSTKGDTRTKSIGHFWKRVQATRPRNSAGSGPTITFPLCCCLKIFSWLETCGMLIKFLRRPQRQHLTALPITRAALTRAPLNGISINPRRIVSRM